jgi:hypothetical protein
MRAEITLSGMQKLGRLQLPTPVYGMLAGIKKAMREPARNRQAGRQSIFSFHVIDRVVRRLFG